MSEFDLPTKEIVRRLTTDERLKRVGLPEGLTPRQANAITKSRLQYAMAQLVDMNVENVHQWLQQVARTAPAEAIRLFMELQEFTSPRLKAAQVNVNANIDPGAGDGRRLQEMSIAELQDVVASQG